MKEYYLNENNQPTGENEVHTSECSYYPSIGSKRYLGRFSTCHEAIREAKKHKSNVDGCIHCCTSCHTR